LRRLIDILFASALIGGLIVLAVRLNGPPAPSLTGRPIIVDGDTLVLDGERLRLAGIDAPELEQNCEADGRTQPCGRIARDALRALAADSVACSGQGHDIYGRRLVRCATGAGDVGARLVETGQAVAEGCCRTEEAAARAAGRGIWAGRFERPSDWRREHPRTDRSP
jgi:endonuclease YncB( thermonuclease family)